MVERAEMASGPGPTPFSGASEAKPERCGTAQSPREWLKQFERRKGRPLRVLHIGNIANNAYNNAKIQRQVGIAADVLNFGYYHTISCPEWEDAQHSGTFKDDMFPDWWAVDLKGYQRPRWFAQGPLDISIRYLLAWTASAPVTAFLWRWMTFERWLLCRRSWGQKLCYFGILTCTRRAVHLGAPANALLMCRAGQVLGWLAEGTLLRKLAVARKLGFWSRYLRRHGRTATGVFSAKRRTQALERLMRSHTAQVNELLSRHGREDRLEKLQSFYDQWYHPYFWRLLKRYDVVQCYSTYTAMPFMIGYRPYLAYEHGTIRSIPFDETDEGRMCLVSYGAAEAVLITNFDTVPSADKMRIEPARRVHLPHAFDDRKLIDFARAHPELKPPAGGVTRFIMPSRQHWVDPHPTWAKGNDRVFEALRIVRASSRRCMLQAIAWGRDVQASKSLIEKLDVGDMVVWSPMMPKHQLWSAYLRSHAVIDQFVMKGFSGVIFEAMTLGCRVITAIDVPLATEFFGEPPPLYNCGTSEEIATAMIRVIDDAEDLGGDGLRNSAWSTRHHSTKRIVDLQLELYRRMLEGQKAIGIDHPRPVHTNSAAQS